MFWGVVDCMARFPRHHRNNQSSSGHRRVKTVQYSSGLLRAERSMEHRRASSLESSSSSADVYCPGQSQTLRVAFSLCQLTCH